MCYKSKISNKFGLNLETVFSYKCHRKMFLWWNLSRQFLSVGRIAFEPLSLVPNVVAPLSSVWCSVWLLSVEDHWKNVWFFGCNKITKEEVVDKMVPSGSTQSGKENVLNIWMEQNILSNTKRPLVTTKMNLIMENIYRNITTIYKIYKHTVLIKWLKMPSYGSLVWLHCSCHSEFNEIMSHSYIKIVTQYF